MQAALSAFELYPKLMVMHMANNYMNNGFERIRMESEEDKGKFRERLRTSLTLRCFMLSSYHTAAPAIDVSYCRLEAGVGSADVVLQEINSRREAALISKLSEEDS